MNDEQAGRFTRDQFTSDAAFYAAVRCQMTSHPELYPEVAEAADETARLAPRIRKAGTRANRKRAAIQEGSR